MLKVLVLIPLCVSGLEGGPIGAAQIMAKEALSHASSSEAISALSQQGSVYSKAVTEMAKKPIMHYGQVTTGFPIIRDRYNPTMVDVEIEESMRNPAPSMAKEATRNKRLPQKALPSQITTGFPIIKDHYNPTKIDVEIESPIRNPALSKAKETIKDKPLPQKALPAQKVSPDDEAAKEFGLTRENLKFDLMFWEEHSKWIAKAKEGATQDESFVLVHEIPIPKAQSSLESDETRFKPASPSTGGNQKPEIIELSGDDEIPSLKVPDAPISEKKVPSKPRRSRQKPVVDLLMGDDPVDVDKLTRPRPKKRRQKVEQSDDEFIPKTDEQSALVNSVDEKPLTQNVRKKRKSDPSAYQRATARTKAMGIPYSHSRRISGGINRLLLKADIPTNAPELIMRGTVTEKVAAEWRERAHEVLYSLPEYQESKDRRMAQLGDLSKRHKQEIVALGLVPGEVRSVAGTIPAFLSKTGISRPTLDLLVMGRLSDHKVKELQQRARETFDALEKPKIAH